MTRHDMPNEVQKFIKVAAEHNIIDELDAITLGVTHGDNWRAMIAEVIEWAFASRHYNGMGHKKVVQAAEAYWMIEAEIAS